MKKIILLVALIGATQAKAAFLTRVLPQARTGVRFASNKASVSSMRRALQQQETQYAQAIKQAQKALKSSKNPLKKIEKIGKQNAKKQDKYNAEYWYTSNTGSKIDTKLFNKTLKTEDQARYLSDNATVVKPYFFTRLALATVAISGFIDRIIG